MVDIPVLKLKYHLVLVHFAVMEKTFRCFRCLKTLSKLMTCLCAMIPIGSESISIPPYVPKNTGSSHQSSSKHSIVRHMIWGLLQRSRHSGICFFARQL